VVSADSSNIVELVLAQYRAITTTLKVHAKSASPDCKAEVTSNEARCKGNECVGVELGTEVHFNLSLTLNKYAREFLSRRISCVATREVIRSKGPQ